MMRTALIAVMLCLPVLRGADIFLHGKVVLEDGSAPGKVLTIEKVCTDELEPLRLAATNPKGEFVVKVTIARIELIGFDRSCVLRASLKGYDSTTVDYDDVRLFQDP